MSPNIEWLCWEHLLISVCGGCCLSFDSRNYRIENQHRLPHVVGFGWDWVGLSSSWVAFGPRVVQDTVQMNEFNPFNSSGMYIPGFRMGITGLVRLSFELWSRTSFGIRAQWASSTRSFIMSIGTVSTRMLGPIEPHTQTSLMLIETVPAPSFVLESVLLSKRWKFSGETHHLHFRI